MICSLSPADLGRYLEVQLNHFFPDPHPVEAAMLLRALPVALARLEKIQRVVQNKYYRHEGKPFFNHLNADHYATFLYLLAHGLGGEMAGRGVATKVFLLNKALHALDVYFEVKLPEIFLFAHPVGTVLGRAQYGNYFVVTQNCTVGNVDGQYPVFGTGVVLLSNSSVLGRCRIGNDVCVGAGSLVINADIPGGHNAVGRAAELRAFPAKMPKWRNYFSVE